MLLRSNFSSFPQYFLHVVRFSCLSRDQISLRYKLLFEISEVERASQLYFIKDLKDIPELSTFLINILYIPMLYYLEDPKDSPILSTFAP